MGHQPEAPGHNSPRILKRLRIIPNGFKIPILDRDFDEDRHHHQQTRTSENGILPMQNGKIAHWLPKIKIKAKKPWKLIRTDKGKKPKYIHATNGSVVREVSDNQTRLKVTQEPDLRPKLQTPEPIRHIINESKPNDIPAVKEAFLDEHIPPQPVFQTDYITTTFQVTNAGIEYLFDDILNEIAHWSQTSHVICSELAWSTPVDRNSTAINEELFSHIISILEADKANLCHKLQLDKDPRPTKEEAQMLHAGAHLNLNRYFSQELVQHYAHSRAQDMHKPFWLFKPGQRSWDEILENFNEETLRKTTVAKLNLICLSLNLDQEERRPVVYQSLPNMRYPALYHDGFKPKNGLIIPPKAVRFNLIDKPTVGKSPATVRKVQYTQSKMSGLSKVQQTKFITTRFEMTHSPLSAFRDEILDELHRWTEGGDVICCEIVWSTPTEHRHLELEREIVESVRRNLVVFKWDLCEALCLDRVPRSSAEGGVRNHRDAFWTGAFRYYTPQLLDLIHEDCAVEHKPYWAFIPEEPPWDSLIEEYGAERLDTLSVVRVHFVCITPMGF